MIVYENYDYQWVEYSTSCKFKSSVVSSESWNF